MPKQTILITGTTSGIGAQTAIQLAQQGHTIYMLVRDIAKGEKEKRNILVQSQNADIHVIACDLTNMATVRKAANEIKAKLTSINVLINNAGGMFPSRQLSDDGFELTFALNHLGHFLLTLSLMPLLQKGKARIINVSSEAHRAAKPDMDDLQSAKNYKSIRAYGNAKLYNIYFAQSLAIKYADRGITAYSLHPGVVKTKFGNQNQGFIKWLFNLMRPFMITAEQGAQTSVYLAEEPGIEALSGKYFKKLKVANTAPIAQNAELREQLWEKSLQLIAPFFS